MSAIKTLLAREPALFWSGLVSAVIALATGFGLQWSAGQITLVMAVVGPVLAVVTRSQVTPVQPPTAVSSGAATITTLGTPQS